MRRMSEFSECQKWTRYAHAVESEKEWFYLTATRLNAALIPAPTDSGSLTAQKCMKNNRGSSVNIWLCNAVTVIRCARSSDSTGLTSDAVSTKSPVVATWPDSAAWKLMASATPAPGAMINSFGDDLVTSRDTLGENTTFIGALAPD